MDAAEGTKEDGRIRQHFQALIEKAPDGVVLIDIEGRFKYVSPSAKRMFGYNPTETVHAHPSELTHPDDLQRVLSELTKILEDPTYIPTIEYRFQSKQGQWRWVETTFSNLLSNRSVNAIVLNFRDVTERKQLEEEFRKSELKYRQIFDNTFDIMAFYEVTDDHRYKVITYNAAEAQLLGPIEQYQNKFIDECIPPELYEQFCKHYERCITEERLITYEEDISFQDFSKTFLTQLIPLKNTEGRVHQIIVISRDTTENKLLQNQLIRQNEILSAMNSDLMVAKERAEESDRLKSAFLANMSHEIRTPMNGILGFAEILSNPDLTGEQQQAYLQIILKSGNRMLNIINDIIDISKIEAGEMHVNWSKTNINEQLEYIHTFFKPETDAKKMRLELKTDLPIEDAYVVTDREKLYAILTNLVKNAVKFTSEGDIEFGYSYKANPDSLLFYVKDAGIGIPKDRQEAIFERFVQADISDRMARQGAGLGLAITKSFVEMLGGKIWVESEVGFGSTFYFTLPFATV